MKYLLLVSLGPIQDFISSARKAQDLWFGSWLLSDLARTAAVALEAADGSKALIFPASVSSTDGDKAAPSVANKILCIVDGDADSVRKLAESGRLAMQERLENLAKPIFEDAEAHIGAKFFRVRAEAQVSDLMEYQWVAVPYDQVSYHEARKRAEQELQALKNTKEWGVVTWGDAVPKSSIDGLRESVFEDSLLSGKKDAQSRGKLHLKDSERLCGVGYLKRRGAEEDSSLLEGIARRPVFHSASHVAAAAVRMRVLSMPQAERETAVQAFDAYRKLLHRSKIQLGQIRVRGRAQQLVFGPGRDLEVTMPTWVSEPTKMPLQTQRFDTTPEGAKSGLFDDSDELSYLLTSDNIVLYEERLPELFEEAGYPKDEKVPAEVKASLKAALSAMGVSDEALPTYYVMLLADGDNMGAYLDELASGSDGEELHRRVSNNLATFAQDALTIIVAHGGSPVYTGGDDVLAFLPLPTALACGDALRRRFAAGVGEGVSKNLSAKPTLSVGMAVAHHLDDLNDVRKQAKEAETLAKNVPGKNALGIVVARRSGPRIELRGKWEELNGKLSLMDRLNTYAEWLTKGSISRKTAHDIRASLIPLRGMREVDRLKEIRSSVVRGVLRQKSTDSRTNSETLERIQTELVDYLDDNGQGLVRLGDELDVAWTFAKAYRLAFNLQPTREA